MNDYNEAQETQEDTYNADDDREELEFVYQAQRRDGLLDRQD